MSGICWFPFPNAYRFLPCTLLLFVGYGYLGLGVTGSPVLGFLVLRANSPRPHGKGCDPNLYLVYFY